jgi:hypothetical protein
MSRRWLGALLVVGLISACTSVKAGPGDACDAALIEQVGDDQLSPQVAGKSTDGLEIWALLISRIAFEPGEPLRMPLGEPLKIVLRVTGAGDLGLDAESLDGGSAQPLDIDPHGGSSFDRPGDEWGTGFEFPTPGCWTIGIARGTQSGSITLEVFEV